MVKKKMMKKKSYKLVRDFLIPNLEKETYGSHLTWEDKIWGSFKISRIHQNNEHFSQDCIEVYKDWSLRRKLWIAKDPQKITKAKHRFVTALRRNPEIEVLDKESSYYRFRFTGPNPTREKKVFKRTSETDDGTEFEEKRDNENIFYRMDIKNSSGYCPSRDDTKHLNKLESNYKLSEELVRPSVICKKYEESEIESISQGDQTLPLADNINSDENGGVLNNKCGCIVLLDSNFLFNKLCIWHGNFP